jgi:hypothetical protein
MRQGSRINQPPITHQRVLSSYSGVAKNVEFATAKLDVVFIYQQSVRLNLSSAPAWTSSVVTQGTKNMRIFVLITLVACVVTATSQQLSGQTRAQEIVASFSKHKSATKEKNGLRVEKYKDVRSEPVAKQNVSDYSGVYEVPELGYIINLQVGSDGRAKANGFETKGDGYQGSRSFRLENAGIEGALLMGTRVYDDGSSDHFEGVFMTRTVRNSPTDVGVTTFGLGVIPNTPFERGGLKYEKLF